MAANVQMPVQQQLMTSWQVPAELKAKLTDQEPELGTCVTGPCMSMCLFAMTCPLHFCCGGCCTQVNQNEHKAILYWGKYEGTLQEPGCYCTNPCGREFRDVSTKYNTMDLKDIKVVDVKGNPINVSGVITFSMVSAKKATIDVQSPSTYIAQQSTTVLKQVASRYPYSAAPGQPSLQTEGAHISQELVTNLQQKVLVAGAYIINFEIVDLSYAPEIAQVMLVKQQAEALVDARRLIVSSAVDMAQSAMTGLESKGVSLSDGARERITSSLLAVICSHQAATPTIPLQG